MRIVTLKRIEELGRNEVELLLKNKAVQKEIIQYAIDNEIELIDMWIEENFEETLNDWYIIERDGELIMDMNMKYHRDFILELEEISDTYDIISENNEVKKLIKKASMIIKSMELLEDEEDDFIWQTLDEKVYDIAIDVKDILVQEFKDEINSLRNFSTIESGYDYMYLWIEDNEQRECMIYDSEISLFNVEK